MKQWDKLEYKYPGIPTMISNEEIRYLYWLALTHWTGEGHIVEMGPWLGGSTICLAAGMRQNTIGKDKKLYVFDNFVWQEFMSRRASLPLKVGDSFQAYFQENLKEYRDLMVVYKQSLPDNLILSDKDAMGIRAINTDKSHLLRWEPKEPVEILFIDGAKSWDGIRFLPKEFSNYLIPGKTLLVCQDYKYWGAYWVLLIMESLSGHLEPIHNLKFNTVTFRLTTEIHSEEIQSLGNFSDISTDYGLECFDRASSRLLSENDKLGAAIIQVCKVRFLAHKNKFNYAVETFRKIESEWPFMEDDRNLELARKWLEGQIGKPLLPTMRSRLRRRVVKYAAKTARLSCSA